jgi:hypothetical protein
MNYKRSLSDILELIVASMVFPINVYKNDNTNFNTTGEEVLYVDDVYHAQVGFIVSIGNYTYTILAVDAWHRTIKVKCTQTAPSSIPAKTYFRLYEPFFFHGTPMTTNTEVISSKKLGTDKVPMFWLLENYQETYFDDPEEAHERESTVRLFALTEADFNKPSQNIHDNNVEPMARLMQFFIYTINTERQTFEKWDYKYTQNRYNKFGVYINNQGPQANLFADNLSGVENQSTLKLLKVGDCCHDLDDNYLNQEDSDFLLMLAEDDESLLIF